MASAFAGDRHVRFLLAMGFALFLASPAHAWVKTLKRTVSYTPPLANGGCQLIKGCFCGPSDSEATCSEKCSDPAKAISLYTNRTTPSMYWEGYIQCNMLSTISVNTDHTKPDAGCTDANGAAPPTPYGGSDRQRIIFKDVACTQPLEYLAYYRYASKIDGSKLEVTGGGGDPGEPTLDSPQDLAALKKLKDAVAPLGAEIGVRVPKNVNSMFGASWNAGIAFAAYRVLRNEPYVRPQVCSEDYDPAAPLESDVTSTVPARNGADAKFNTHTATLYGALEGRLHINLAGRIFGMNGNLVNVAARVTNLTDISLLPDFGKLNELKRRGIGTFRYVRDVPAGKKGLFQMWDDVQRDLDLAAANKPTSLGEPLGAIFHRSTSTVDSVMGEISKIGNSQKFFSQLKRNLGKLEPGLSIRIFDKMVYKVDRYETCDTTSEFFSDWKKADNAIPYGWGNNPNALQFGPLKSTMGQDHVDRPSFSGKINGKFFNFEFAQTLWAGPVPILVKAGATGASLLNGSHVFSFELPSTPNAVTKVVQHRDALAGYINKTEFGAQGTFAVNLIGYASAGVGFALGKIAEISAGIEAQATIVEAMLSPRLTVRPGASATLKDFSGTTGLYAAGGMTVLRVYVYIYARVKILFAKKEFRKVLFEFKGKEIFNLSDGVPIRQWKLGKWGDDVNAPDTAIRP